jgi:hypothetical protein
MIKRHKLFLFIILLICIAFIVIYARLFPDNRLLLRTGLTQPRNYQECIKAGGSIEYKQGMVTQKYDCVHDGKIFRYEGVLNYF